MISKKINDDCKHNLTNFNRIKNKKKSYTLKELLEKKFTCYGEIEENTKKQALNCLQDSEYFLLMADNHYGYGMPVGGVGVYKEKICPAGVGFDIACGNKAIKLNLKYQQIKDKTETIADKIWNELSFGIGRKNKTQINHAIFDKEVWNKSNFLTKNPVLKKKAQEQLGTIGAGNHYVDVFYDEENYIWVGVHFGSRGLGHTIASHFMKIAGDNLNIMDDPPKFLQVDSAEGKDYLDCMELAGEYAYAGRNWVCQKVADILQTEIIDEVHNHHNFAWKENHNEQSYYVIRKGATPCFPKKRGFIGSNMEDYSVIVEGLDNEVSRKSFYSTIHGSGRIMSRSQAIGKKKLLKEFLCNNRNCDGSIPFDPILSNPKCEKCGTKMRKNKKWSIKSKGLVDYSTVQERIKKKGIILRGGGADESPEVYKKLTDVLKYHEKTIKIQHKLYPIIVCMAQAEIYDPYKD